MHLVAAYFDSQLFPLPHTAPDGRQFSSAHYVKAPAVPIKNKKSLIISQQTINPPHFQLIIGEDTYDISRVSRLKKIITQQTSLEKFSDGVLRYHLFWDLNVSKIINQLL